MKVIHKTLQLAALIILLVASRAYAEETTKYVFEKYGFTMEAPKDLGLHCEEDKMDTFAEVANKQKIMGTVCSSPFRNPTVLRVGWRAEFLSNTEFSRRTASDLVGKDFGAGKPFESKCNNRTGIDSAVGAQGYPEGQRFSTRAFSCLVTVTVEDTSKTPVVVTQHTFTIFYLFFFTRKNPDTVNWITVSDNTDKPGSATWLDVVSVAKTIKLLK
jgi:hypothetical protein